MRALLIASLIVAIAGCATTKGPPLIYSANGPAPAPTEAQQYSLARAFVAAAHTAACPALKCENEVDKDGATHKKCPAIEPDSPCPGWGSTDPQVIGAQAKASAAMFDVGAALLHANCSQFFTDAGRTQTQLMVWKDAIGLLGTLAAGVIALDGGGTGDLDRLAVISLGSSAALASIDIYTQRFLFAAENVDSVRELTLTALNAHAERVKEAPPKSYAAASRHLLDNQALCLPPRIAMMARDAIKNGEVVAYTSGSGPSPELTEANDRLILQDLGDKLGLAGPLTMRQAAGYYWLLVIGANPGDQSKFIQPMLVDIPPGSNPFVAQGALKAEIPHRGFVRERLSRLGARSVKALAGIISTEKGATSTEALHFESPADIEQSRVKIEVR